MSEKIGPDHFRDMCAAYIREYYAQPEKQKGFQHMREIFADAHSLLREMRSWLIRLEQKLEPEP